MELLQGKKSYITGVLMIVLGSLELIGISVPGVEVGNATNMIGTGFGIVFLRSGIKTG